MKDAKRRAELTHLVEQRRRELSERPDISQTMRRLSQSSSRNQIGPATQISQQLRQRSPMRTLILTGIGAAVLLTCIIGTVAVVWANTVVQTNFSDPQTTVQQFYGALHQANYGQAYGYFSSNAKAHLSESAFEEQYGGYDSVDGIVQDYPIQSSVVHGNTANVTVLITRRNDDGTAQLQTLHLVKSGNNWLIDGIKLGKTIQLPTPTASS